MPDATPPSPEPFASRTTEAELADLKARLRATRWPDTPQDLGWSLGADVGYLRELATYWAGEFDWPAQEAALERFPRFRVKAGGYGIHFVHAKAKSDGQALPLVLCHGWPDSFWRYTKVIDLLTSPADPADAFDVIVPDMPGYGYSDHPVGLAPDTPAVAALWAELMTVLGYEKFVVAGGDIGSTVARYLALDFPERIKATHRMDVGRPLYAGPAEELAGEERKWFAQISQWGATEGAYGLMHSTKPQTPAVGLNDSPAGLAAWITEKLRAWSDCKGDVETRFTKDEILTNVSIFWLTQTIGPSMRMYQSNSAIPAAQFARRVEVPSGFTFFPADISRPPTPWLERTNSNVVKVTDAPRGGHFAPFEEPEYYAGQLRDFFRPYRG